MKTKFVLSAIFVLFIFIFNSLNAQTVLTAKKVTQSRGVSEYVIPTTDVFVEKPALSRGGCLVKLDNWTGFYVDVWIDKVYKGRLNPWETSSIVLPKSFEEVYCRTIGDTYHWFSEGECNEQFLLKMEESEEQEIKKSDGQDF